MWTSVTDCCLKMVNQITRRKSVRKLRLLVLYVCERVNRNVGGVMAAARERSSSRHATGRSAQRDPTQGFPIQVSLPDGETSHHHYNPCLRHNGGPEQEAEMVRGYLKPPENKSLLDMECVSPSRSCSMGVLGGLDEWEMVGSGMSSSSPRVPSCVPLQSTAGGVLQPHRSYSTATSPHPKHRLSTPLEPRGGGHSTAPSSSLSLSSSSSSSMSSNSMMGGSPKGRKASFQMQFFPTFLTPREKPSSSSHHEGGRRPGRPSSRSHGGAQAAILRNAGSVAAGTTTALAGITVVPCGAGDVSPQPFPHDEHLYSHHISTDLAAPGLGDDEPPPIYSEVIENPSLYRDVSSRTERRTNSGKI